MVTFKVIIKEKEKRKDGTVNVKIRVTFRRDFRMIATDYYVLPEYFDANDWILPHGDISKDDASRYNNKIRIQLGVLATKVDNQGDRVRNMDINSLMLLLRDKRINYDLLANLQDRANAYKELGNHGYYNTINRTYNHVVAFAGQYVPFEGIDVAWLQRFERHLLLNGKCYNTIGIYMRDIRTSYNDAINRGVVDLSAYPFRRYKIKKEKTDHRTLTFDEMFRIATKDLSKEGWVANFTRDMFMLTFYLIGINFKDLSELTEIVDMRIKYSRSKGKKRYSIYVHPEALEIIEKYRGKKRLLNIIDHYADYLGALHEVDDKLKTIANLCEIDKPLTTYYARHSWATLASEMGIPEDVIAYGLGHTISNEITPIYIDYNISKVDKANRKLINKILHRSTKHRA